MLMTTTPHYIMFFTTKGRMYRLKVYQIPECGRTARGTAIINLIQLMPEEKITAVITLRDYDENKYLFMATKKGIVKKVYISGVKSVKAGKKLYLKGKTSASSGANRTLKWSSSNTKYAKVSSKGTVTTYKAGKKKSVKITARAVDGSGKSKTVTIKIK